MTLHKNIVAVVPCGRNSVRQGTNGKETRIQHRANTQRTAEKEKLLLLGSHMHLLCWKLPQSKLPLRRDHLCLSHARQSLACE